MNLAESSAVDAQRVCNTGQRITARKLRTEESSEFLQGWTRFQFCPVRVESPAEHADHSTGALAGPRASRKG